MYSLEWMPEAGDDLGGLDKPVAQRVLNKLRWLTENFDAITPEPLTGDMEGLVQAASRQLSCSLHDQRSRTAAHCPPRQAPARCLQSVDLKASVDVLPDYAGHDRVLRCGHERRELGS